MTTEVFRGGIYMTPCPLIHLSDRQTERRTDEQTKLRRLGRAIAVVAVARKNTKRL